MSAEELGLGWVFEGPPAALLHGLNEAEAEALQLVWVNAEPPNREALAMAPADLRRAYLARVAGYVRESRAQFAAAADDFAKAVLARWEAEDGTALVRIRTPRPMRFRHRPSPGGPSFS